MTNQTLVSDRSVDAPVGLCLVETPQAPAKASATSYSTRILEAMKAQYQVDQQLKFLHLQAETESLLQQLKAIQQQRQATGEPVTGNS